MKVYELIEALKKQNPDTPVRLAVPQSLQTDGNSTFDIATIKHSGPFFQTNNLTIIVAKKALNQNRL